MPITVPSTMNSTDVIVTSLGAETEALNATMRFTELVGAAIVTVGSAGVSAVEGSAASDGATLVALERGLDLSLHRARPLTRELLEEADVVLAMGPPHAERAHFLGAAPKTFLLQEFASHGESWEGVTDPFGSDLTTYRATFDELEIAIRRVLDRLVAEPRPPRS